MTDQKDCRRLRTEFHYEVCTGSVFRPCGHRLKSEGDARVLGSLSENSCGWVLRKRWAVLVYRLNQEPVQPLGIDAIQYFR
jgi:hypothetical protein